MREAGVDDVSTLHRHGGVVETILEREENARVVILGRRGTDHEFAPEHIGSMIERVVRSSIKPVMIVSRAYCAPEHVVFAYDGSPAAKRALERLANSPLFDGLPVTIIMAEAEGPAKRAALAEAEAAFAPGHPVTSLMTTRKAETVIPEVVGSETNPLLLMGAYGHSPLRRLFIGSTTTEMIRTIPAPVLLVR